MKTKLAPMSFRASPEMRERLRDAADESGRSVTQEIERRLDRSFDLDDLRSIGALDALVGFVRERSEEDEAEREEEIERRLQATAENIQFTPCRDGMNVWTSDHGFEHGEYNHVYDVEELENCFNYGNYSGASKKMTLELVSMLRRVADAYEKSANGDVQGGYRLTADYRYHKQDLREDECPPQ